MFMGKNNIIKMSKLPKARYRFNTISIKIPTVFFTENQYSNSIWNCKESQIAKTFLEKKVAGLTLPWLPYYKTIDIKIYHSGIKKNVA